MNLSPWYLVCTKAMIISKGSYGYGEPKNVISWLVQIPHRPVRAGKLLIFRTLRIGPSMKIAEIRVNLSPWYLVCTKAMFISKGSYGYGEPKNVICWVVQIPHRPVRARKLPMFRTLRIGPAMKFAETSSEPIAMVPCLHQGNVYMKRKLRVWRAQKCNLLVGANTAPTSTGPQTSHVSYTPYRAAN